MTLAYEADAGHAGESPLRSLVRRDPTSIRERVRSGSFRGILRLSAVARVRRAKTFAVPSGRKPNVAPFERPFTTALTVSIASGGDDEPITGHGGELRGVVRPLGVQDFDPEAAGAQDFGKALQVPLVPRASRIGVADYDRFRCHTYSAGSSSVRIGVSASSAGRER